MRRLGFCLLLLAVAQGAGARALLLKGFRLVDPGDRSVLVRDVVLRDGRVVAETGAGLEVVDGHGQWLLPAFWDLKASLWGNDSALNYRDVSQEMGISECLRVQLWYGVAHVAAEHMGDEWVARERKRAEALEFPAAELLYGGKMLSGAAPAVWAAEPITRAADIAPMIAARKAAGAPFVRICYSGELGGPVPFVDGKLLGPILKEAARRGLPSYVVVPDWRSAREAVLLGANAVAALPQEAPPAALIALMRARHCAYVPMLSYLLEGKRLLEHPELLKDPWLTATVSAPVLETFRHPDKVWAGWSPLLALAEVKQSRALRGLRAMDQGGVDIVNASDAGWVLGSFQGHATLANQAWMEAAGVSGWTRLRALTVNPAGLVGRHVGFQPGDPADFVGVGEDPLGPAQNLGQISTLILRGELVDRDALRPDTKRTKFRPFP